MLLICVDSFTKFVWMYPVRRALASTTVKILQERLFKDYGTPVHLVSDNGPQFKAKEFKNMCFKLGIDHITTTEYRPQGNIAERYLRNLKSALIAYHANDHTSWDQNLSWIQYAFNSAYHEGHKSTPFELLYKYKPNHPLSTKWKIHDLPPQQIKDKQIKRIWIEARANLRANLEKSRKYHKRSNDKMCIRDRSTTEYSSVASNDDCYWKMYPIKYKSN